MNWSEGGTTDTISRGDTGIFSTIACVAVAVGAAVALGACVAVGAAVALGACVAGIAVAGIAVAGIAVAGIAVAGIAVAGAGACVAGAGAAVAGTCVAVASSSPPQARMKRVNPIRLASNRGTFQLNNLCEYVKVDTSKFYAWQ